MLDCDITVSSNSSCAITFTFRLIPLGKVWTLLSPQLWVKKYLYCSSLALNIQQGWYAIKQRNQSKSFIFFLSLFFFSDSHLNCFLIHVIPPSSSLFADDIIRRRLLIDGDGGNDDKRINSLLRLLVRWCNMPDNDDERYAPILSTSFLLFSECC